MATITVTLRVQTSKLKYKKDVDQFCSFTGMSAGANPELFTTQAKAGDIVVWKGESSDSPGDTVEILDIKRYGGNKVLSDPTPVPTGKQKCTVSGQKYNWQKYNIFFTINGGEKKFKIDPIINVYA